MAEYLTRKLKGHVPFGYIQDAEDPQLLLPVPKQLDLLTKALELLDQKCKLREVARWLSAHAQRPITHEGLKAIYCNSRNLPYKKKKRARK